MNRSLNIQLLPFLKNMSVKRGAIFGSILIVALLSFEVFNFGTTSFALHDILGDLTFAGIRWSTLLAFAFCGIDFAGIARIFTPEQGREEPQEVWYLFGAWLLAAGFNASLTWWGVSVAVTEHNTQSVMLANNPGMISLVPLMVAAMVWLIRVLIIGTFSVAGERLFTLADARPHNGYYRQENARPAAANQPLHANLPRAVNTYPRPVPKPQPAAPAQTYVPRPEPTYHPVMSALPRSNNNVSARK